MSDKMQTVLRALIAWFSTQPLYATAARLSTRLRHSSRNGAFLFYVSAALLLLAASTIRSGYRTAADERRARRTQVASLIRSEFEPRSDQAAQVALAALLGSAERASCPIAEHACAKLTSLHEAVLSQLGREYASTLPPPRLSRVSASLWKATLEQEDVEVLLRADVLENHSSKSNDPRGAGSETPSLKAEALSAYKLSVIFAIEVADKRSEFKQLETSAFAPLRTYLITSSGTMAVLDKDATPLSAIYAKRDNFTEASYFRHFAHDNRENKPSYYTYPYIDRAGAGLVATLCDHVKSAPPPQTAVLCSDFAWSPPLGISDASITANYSAQLEVRSGLPMPDTLSLAGCDSKRDPRSKRCTIQERLRQELKRQHGDREPSNWLTTIVRIGDREDPQTGDLWWVPLRKNRNLATGVVLEVHSLDLTAQTYSLIAIGTGLFLFAFLVSLVAARQRVEVEERNRDMVLMRAVQQALVRLDAGDEIIDANERADHLAGEALLRRKGPTKFQTLIDETLFLINEDGELDPGQYGHVRGARDRGLTHSYIAWFRNGRWLRCTEVPIMRAEARKQAKLAGVILTLETVTEAERVLIGVRSNKE